MPVTIKKIAIELGLSPATVSLALNGSPLVAEKTKKLVCEKAAELDYVPNNFGRGLQSRRSRLIGYMCNTIVNSFNSETMEACGMLAAANNYGMLLGVVGQNLEHFDAQLQLFMEKHVDGLIIALDNEFDVEQVPGFMRKIKQRELPVLACATDIVNAQIPVVSSNDFDGAYSAAEYILKLGHRYVVVPRVNTMRRRLEGYEAACRDYGANVFYSDNAEDACDIVATHPEVTAMLISNDYVATYILSKLHHLGLRVPDDISVIGFDDVWYAARPEYSLTTMAQRRAKLGAISMMTMLKMIDGEEVPDEQLIETSLVIRNTTSWPNSRRR